MTKQLLKSLIFTTLTLTLTIACTAHPSPTKPHVALLGDSNTWNGGDNCDNPTGWSKWFGEQFPTASLHSYARSGATWSCTPRTVANTTEDIAVLGDNNVIFNQVLRLKQAVASGQQATPDIIIISAGTNDVWFNKKRPHALDAAPRATTVVASPSSKRAANTVVSIADAIGYNCQLLRESFPDARIVLITPMASVKVPETRMAQVSDIITRTGHQMGADVISLDYKGGISRSQELRGYRFTSDGTHTNVDGARLNGSHIATELKSLTDR